MGRMGRVAIEILQGDITESKCDAIVNAANNELWMGSGVAGAIKAKGGQKIEDEARAKGPIEPGEAVETTAGTLRAEYVIHAAGMGQDLKTSEELIRKSTVSALEVAERLKVSSVALPAIGTGVGGFDASKCADIMIGAVRDFDAKYVKIVHFVLFDDASMKAFEDVKKQIL